MKSIVGKFKDKPSLTTILIIVIIALQVFLVKCGIIPYWLGALCKNDRADDLYLSMLSVAALQASFAGVIVVFGLSTQPKSFRNLRIAAGEALVNNWMSISYSGFLSAGCALAATLTNMLGDKWFSPWFFEASVLFCVHGVIRLLWLLKQLIKIIKDVDSKIAQQDSER
ncbi:hypothetical protein H6A68_01985 [Bifidobacterium pullorum subsp. saeculare]|uniref:hypothetical protein n=1 Tax=Bifidobacterium pullorum TaxID=78448 RepID=UPI001956228C|nr:hypothetical protein [Bifidobacterium pullorum]MBM6705838.1 hypothetical protein [Bifidobacterium pullorum subsp. saeculare]